MQVQRNIAASDADAAAPAAASPTPRGVGALGGGGVKSEGSQFTEGLQTDTVGIDTSLFGEVWAYAGCA